jgi:catechol 2,3-dioxygenase-like lactoylglutathione lyase family enzyme
VPIDHVKLPVSDLAASRSFYAAALAPFGWRLVYDGESSLGFGAGDGGEDNEPFAVEVVEASWAASHIAITAASERQVDEFHAAAVAAGGRDNGAPGLRPYGGYYYAAFVLDPDGHNIEAVFHGTGDRREPSS